MLRESAANRLDTSIPARTRSAAALLLGESLAGILLGLGRGLQGNDFRVVKTHFSAVLTETGSKLYNGQYCGPADGRSRGCAALLESAKCRVFPFSTFSYQLTWLHFLPKPT